MTISMKIVFLMTKKEMIMTKHILLLASLLLTSAYADTIKDQDFDGVPDNIDECQDTPFLNEVNQIGCTISILTLPFETEKESMTLSLGYGFSTNEDLIDREKQRNTKLKISYYLNNWSYTIQTGYYEHDLHQGVLDTIIRVRKRIKINPQFVISLGTGLRLPSYDFEGNKMDGLLYGSLHYYPTSSLSFVAGYNYTYIGDDETPSNFPEPLTGDNDAGDNVKELYLGLQNKHKYYGGIGYFITDNLYMNLLYSDESSKFISEHRIKTVSSSIYYKINDKWFSTLYYKQEVDDNDLHNNLLFTIGYTLW